MLRSRGATSLTTLPPMRERAVGDVLEAGDHAQGGGLAAARGSDEHEELAVGDVERQVLHGMEAVVVDLVDMVQHQFRHGYTPSTRHTPAPADGTSMTACPATTSAVEAEQVIETGH